MENKFKGTPGPWVQNGKNGVHTPNGRCVALTYEVDGGPDNRTENAKLIAAAPDLLAFAVDFAQKVETGRAKSTDSYNKAINAINKALGNETTIQD